MAFNNLPGIIVNTVDGGLVSAAPPQDHSILIIGTCDQGVINQPYQVTNRAMAALQFGLNGNLIRSMEECAANSDNVILFRMGAQPQVLAGIGVETGTGATAGFSLSFGQATATSATDYKIWYKAGVVAVYYQGDLEYSNDPLQTTDNGDISIAGTISGNTGLQLGTGASATFANAITVQAAAALVGATSTPPPTLTAAITGIGLTGRQTYLAFLDAINLLQGFQVEEVVVPAATFDAPNVAFYSAGNTATATNNPATNPNALDWLLIARDAYGDQTYQWASEANAWANGAQATTFPAGLTAQTVAGTSIPITAGAVTAMPGTVATASARQALGFAEVNWGYAIASFCASISTLDKTCIGFIGTSVPATYKLVDVRRWVGFLPHYNANDDVQNPGAGLLGIPYTVGTNASGLNALCFDYSSGYRQPGFFQTENGQYDGTVMQDINQNNIDIGAYLHVVADQAIMSNGYATNYVSNLANYVAGFCSALDEKTALTNQKVPLKQLPGLIYTPGQLDSLTQANINVLRTKGSYSNPALLHDFTCATDISDYTELLRVRIKGLVIATMLAIGDPFVGASSLDGLQLVSLKTALDNGLVALQQRGYISNPQVTITTTAAESLIGHANLFLTFHPADELVQLSAYVGLSS
jgi:hypothetical protein